MSESKIVLVFGAFDGLHDGHRFFLREAQKLGSRLVASVAQDTVVADMKGHCPVLPLTERLTALRKSGLVSEAAPGDTERGRWSAVKTFQPDIVALGYDQIRLEKMLRVFIKRKRLPITLVRLPAHKPETHHSSLLLLLDK